MPGCTMYLLSESKPDIQGHECSEKEQKFKVTSHDITFVQNIEGQYFMLRMKISKTVKPKFTLLCCIKFMYVFS